MSIAVTCELCGRQWRVKDDYAGKRIRCKKCRSRIQVPGAIVDPTPASRFESTETPLPPVGNRKQPKKKKSLNAKRKSLKRVGKGLMLLYISFIGRFAWAIALLVLPFVLPDDSPTFENLRMIVPISAVVLALVGEVLCLWVPAETNARPYIYAAVAMDVVSVADSLFELHSLLSALAFLLWLGAFVSLVFFMRHVAAYIDKNELVNDAERLVVLPIVIAVLYASMFVGPYIPLFGVIFWFVMPIVIFLCLFGTIPMIVRYGTLLRDLRMAVEGYY